MTACFCGIVSFHCRQGMYLVINMLGCMHTCTLDSRFWNQGIVGQVSTTTCLNPSAGTGLLVLVVGATPLLATANRFRMFHNQQSGEWYQALQRYSMDMAAVVIAGGSMCLGLQHTQWLLVFLKHNVH